MKKSLLIIFLFYVSCQFGFDSKHLIDKYYLTELDGHTDISYNIKNDEFVGVIGPQVLAVGYNEQFIWSKCRNLESNALEYFIIPIEDKVFDSPDDNKIGPLNEAAFKEKLDHFGLAEIDFVLDIEK